MKSAPIRSSAQSPPLGLPRGSKYVGRVAVNATLLIDTSVIGCACTPSKGSRSYSAARANSERRLHQAQRD
jgi:hypothetical protein